VPRRSVELERVWSRVAEAQAGDRQAFAEIYRLYAPVVFRYVFGRTKDRHLAEDLTSDTFVRAMRKLGSVTYRGTPFRAWLLTIARNVVIDEVKSARRRIDVPLPEDFDRPAHGVDPEAEVINQELADKVSSLLAGLSADQRACVELRFLADLTIPEAARRMDRGPRAISALQLRALRKLRDLMATRDREFYAA
jgi:RNA polymerase sigma-70 factor (ECF subfamily)